MKLAAIDHLSAEKHEAPRVISTLNIDTPCATHLPHRSDVQCYLASHYSEIDDEMMLHSLRSDRGIFMKTCSTLSPQRRDSFEGLAADVSLWDARAYVCVYKSNCYLGTMLYQPISGLIRYFILKSVEMFFSEFFYIVSVKLL